MSPFYQKKQHVLPKSKRSPVVVGLPSHVDEALKSTLTNFLPWSQPKRVKRVSGVSWVNDGNLAKWNHTLVGGFNPFEKY